MACCTFKQKHVNYGDSNQRWEPAATEVQHGRLMASLQPFSEVHQAPGSQHIQLSAISCVQYSTSCRHNDNASTASLILTSSSQFAGRRLTKHLLIVVGMYETGRALWCGGTPSEPLDAPAAQPVPTSCYRRAHKLRLGDAGAASGCLRAHHQSLAVECAYALEPFCNCIINQPETL